MESIETITFKIEGLHCAEEIAVLKKVIGEREGIINLDFNLLNSKMTVTFDPQYVDSSNIIQLVARTGMRAARWDDRRKKRRSSQKFLRLISTSLSFLLLVTGILVHIYIYKGFYGFVEVAQKGGLTSFPEKILYLLAIIAGVWMVLPKAYFSIRNIRPDMNLLMMIAIVGAIAIGEWFEAASVGFLFSLALLLEEQAVERARKAVSKLLDLAPPRAYLLDRKSGKLTEMAVVEVEVGSIILIRPGEKVPLDGIVEEGRSSINQSPITGESIPVSKDIGDEVFAGTLNEEGALEVKVTKSVQNTTLAKIIRLVDEARSKRSQNEQWVEKFARIYTPLMILFALSIILFPPLLLGGSFTPWIYRGLVLLVIACPCALVISTPVSIVSALTSAARMGVLIKGGIFLEIIGQIEALAMDKTGTLTFGHPEVREVIPLNEHTATDLLVLAASLEQKSEHPIARAILKATASKNIDYPLAENFEVLKGKGAKGTIAGKEYWIGSHRFMHDMGQESEEIHNQALLLEDAGHTMIAIGTSDHVCGLISVADSPRPFIEETIRAIKALGIKKIVMLTGDNEGAAKALAKLTGVDEYYAELLPEDKVEAVRELQRKFGSVAMIGDGINDAPALATANIGIAMGGMGTDVAIEVSDIALMSDDLAKVPWLIQHSRRTLRIIKENIAFALGVKAIFFFLALFELATLWMAIAADTGATLIVISNALRLLNRKQES